MAAGFPRRESPIVLHTDQKAVGSIGQSTGNGRQSEEPPPQLSPEHKERVDDVSSVGNITRKQCAAFA